MARFIVGCLTAAVVAAWVGVAAAAPPALAPDFTLIDQRGRAHQLSRAPGRMLVLFVTGNGCPIARQSVPALKELRRRYLDRGVDVWMLDSNLQDDRASLAKEAEDLDVGRIPILQDEAQLVARALEVDHTGEAIAVELPSQRIIYRGAIDDRLSVGTQRPAAAHTYLEDAVKARLAGRPVPRPHAPVAGCAVTIESKPEVAYSVQVAPVLTAACTGCHAPGGAHPRLASYADIKANVAKISGVLLTRAMPPDLADLHDGLPLAGPKLDATGARTLSRWIEAGAPRGAGDDPLSGAPAAPARVRVHTTVAAEPEEISIAAGEPEGRAFALYRFPKAAVIHNLQPRLDRRASWVTYEALEPDGARATLLSVPRLGRPAPGPYRLATPKPVAAGTRLLVTVGFDNSPRNPANKTPNARITCAGPACAALVRGEADVEETAAPGGAASLSKTGAPR